MDFITRLKKEYGLALNPQQEQAVRTLDGAVLLLAVPGSGKTTVLAARLANMLQGAGVPPHKILTLTFSRRSAADMERRYAQRFPDAPRPKFSTIHSFCYGVTEHISLQYHRPLPRVTAEIVEIVRGLYCTLENVRFVERETLDEVVAAIGFSKNRLATAEQVQEIQIEGCDFARLYEAYQIYMREHRLMDYDDMLVFTYDMFRKNPAFLAQYHAVYSHICVDEAQDTSLVQHRIIEQLAEKSGNLFLVGDEDQSIYGFRGAYPEALLTFEKTHPGGTILKMEQNYRSGSEVVKAANRLIRQNRARLDKQMFTEKQEAGTVTAHEVNSPSAQYEKLVELLGDREGSAAVLYRNNESAIPLVDALNRAGAAFSLKDTRDAFFQTAHVRDMTAFLRLALDPSDAESFAQIYSKTSAYLNRAALDYVRSHHKAGESVFVTLRRSPEIEGGRLENLRTQLAQMKKQSPVNALNLLENVVSRNYFNSDSASRRLLLLKSIATKQETLEDLLARLDELQSLVKSAPAFGSGITLSTIHSSKGLEYDTVFLVDLIEGQFPSKACTDQLDAGDRAAYEEEVRLCYVAATRARSQLHLITFAPGNRVCRPSRFVRLLTTDPAAPKAAPAPLPRAEKQIEGYQPVSTPEQLRSGMSVLHDGMGEGRILRVEAGYMTWFDGVTTKRFFIQTCIENQNLFLKEADKT